MTHTTSFPDIVASCRDWLANKSVKMAVDTLVRAVGGTGHETHGGFIQNKIADMQEADPNVDVLQDHLVETIKFLMIFYWPVLAGQWPALAARAEIANRVLNKVIDGGLRTKFGAIKDDVHRLIVTSRSTGMPLDQNLRVVKNRSHLLFEEARRYYYWRGILVEARLGTAISRLDESKFFLIYCPRGGNVKSKGFEMHIIKQAKS